MRTALAFIFLTAGAFAADSIVEGPRLGYLGMKAGARPVLGIVGALQFGRTVVGDWLRSVLLPGSDVMMAADSRSRLVRVDMRSGQTLDLNIENVDALAASPSGHVALVLTADRATWLSRSGERLGDVALPARALRTSVADVGTAAAIVVAEPGGEVLWVLNGDGAHRLIRAEALPALGSVADSADFLVADGAGTVSRISRDLQVTPVTSLAGVTALAATPSAAVLVAKGAVSVLRFQTGERRPIECACSATMATPIAPATFVLTDAERGPSWLLDLSGDSARTAFIPEAVDE
jgi:hypothetical protein